MKIDQIEAGLFRLQENLLPGDGSQRLVAAALRLDQFAPLCVECGKGKRLGGLQFAGESHALFVAPLMDILHLRIRQIVFAPGLQCLRLHLCGVCLQLFVVLQDRLQYLVDAPGLQ